MADRAIQDLTPVQTIYDSDNFVLEQNSVAKRLTGQTLVAWLLERLDGHGGIQSITLMSTSAEGKTYKVTYSDGTYDTFLSPKGDKGDKGDKGETGDNLTIKSTEIRYASGTSATSAPSSGWQSTVPNVAQGAYLWTRTKITYSENSTFTYYTVARQGRDGSGSVNTVNGVSPDANGNIAIASVDDQTLVIELQ